MFKIKDEPRDTSADKNSCDMSVWFVLATISAVTAKMQIYFQK